MNQVYIDKQQYKEIADTCEVQKAKRDTALAGCEKINNSLLAERNISDTMHAMAADIVIGKDKEIKKRDKKIRKLNIKSAVLGTLGTMSALGVVGTVTAVIFLFTPKR